MIIFLVLIFFITTSYYVIFLHDSVKSTDAYIQKIYRKIQAYHIFESSLPIIIETLKRDDHTVDSFKDIWAYPLILNTKESEIKITIYDEDRFLNLNLAGENKWAKVFQRLFKILNIESDYLDNLLIWIGNKKGTLNTEYPVKRDLLHSKEELLYLGFNNEDLVGKKIGNEFLPGLFSLTTVYSSGKVNINTAPTYVLRALDDRIDETLANKIKERRNREAFKNSNEIIMIEGFSFDILHSISPLIDIKSRYFHFIVEIKLNETITTFETIYDRQQDKIVWKKMI